MLAMMDEMIHDVCRWETLSLIMKLRARADDVSEDLDAGLDTTINIIQAGCCT